MPGIASVYSEPTRTHHEAMFSVQVAAYLRWMVVPGYTAKVASGAVSAVVNRRISSVKGIQNQDLKLDNDGKDDSKWPTDPRTGEFRKGNNWDYQAELSALAVRLGHRGEELPSLPKALECERVQGTHSLPTKSRRGGDEPNRLSVLGKSVMHYYVNEYLYYSYPMMNGCMLQDLGLSVTNYSSLNHLASYIGVTDLIQTKTNLSLPSNIPIVAQSFCAVIGAVYQDRGPKAARAVVHDLVVSQLAGKDLEEIVKLQHPRFMLTSILISQGRPHPVSRLLSESGRATHFPSFRVGFFSGSDLLGEGTGTSLRRAEREAMLTALRSHFIKELSQASLPSDSEDYSSEAELRDKMCVELDVQ